MKDLERGHIEGDVQEQEEPKPEPEPIVFPDEEEGVVTADTQEEPEVEEIVDDEITDEEIVDAPDDEDSWLEERWEDLTDAVKNIFRRSKHFAGCSGPGSCPGFGKISRRRKKRILRSISLAWPRIKWPTFVIRWPKIRFRKRRFSRRA